MTHHRLQRQLSSIPGHTCGIREHAWVPLLTRRAPLRRALIVRVRVIQGRSRGPAWSSHHTHPQDPLLHRPVSTHLCVFSSSTESARCDASRTDGARAPRIQQPTAEQCLCCWLCTRTSLATRNHVILSRTTRLMRTLRTPPCHYPFISPDPNWVDERLGGRPNISREQLCPSHSYQGFQHTFDRMRLWSFVGHLTGFRHVVKLLYQHCVRGQVGVCAMSKGSTVHGHLWPRRLAGIFSRTGCASPRASSRFHVSLCLSGGRACVSFSLASPPRLQYHLCPSVSFDLTLAHSAWENCTTACRKGSHTHLSGSTRLFLCSPSILPADFRHRTDPSTSFNRVFRPLSACRPSSTINSVTVLTTNLRSTFRVSTLLIYSELSGTSSGGSI